MSDRKLLDQFLVNHDLSAFEAIVRRYGPLVRSVGRDVMVDPHDADDVFQATFLVLLRNAPSIRDANLLGSWLHGVAYRIAVRAKQQSARRLAREHQGVEMVPDPSPCPAEDDRDEEMTLLHEELNRLPATLREPIFLCHLEGLTYEDAASRLRCPLGTFKARLSRGRALLRSRLMRRGVSAPVALLLALLSSRASAASIDDLVDPTVQLGLSYAENGIKAVPDHLARLATISNVSQRTVRTSFWLLLLLLLLLSGMIGGCDLLRDPAARAGLPRFGLSLPGFFASGPANGEAACH